VAGGAARLRDESGALGRHIATDPVVECPRHHPLIAHLERTGVDDAHIADAYELARLIGRLRPDVDVELLELRCLLAIVALQEVDRLAGDDAGDHASASHHAYALAHEHEWIPAAHLAEAQVALVVDVSHMQPDLI